MRREIIIAALYCISKRKKKLRRRLYVHPLIEQRAVAGEFVTLYGTLRADETKFFNYFRMSTSTFDELLAKTGDKLIHASVRRMPIPPIERLMVTLRKEHFLLIITASCLIIRVTWSLIIGLIP
ncbi:unnamed protein product [Diabrotica balteata]|uniref:Uncharacterized protein n=1 Tax=Diabrotica balteata TaxID=107213 RepID=A0A9N9TDG1_DIABA|nr:unnamed protein product [Diabrotica balteata]